MLDRSRLLTPVDNLYYLLNKFIGFRYSVLLILHRFYASSKLIYIILFDSAANLTPVIAGSASVVILLGFVIIIVIIVIRRKRKGYVSLFVGVFGLLLIMRFHQSYGNVTTAGERLQSDLSLAKGPQIGCFYPNL